ELFTAVFADWGMPASRARTEATLVVDATFGLLTAPLSNGGEDQADAAFHMLLDRLETGWRAGPGA
ncbi:TetR/AcrR family transcriptional regulator, partial [Streptomyces sp. NPDC051453]